MDAEMSCPNMNPIHQQSILNYSVVLVYLLWPRLLLLLSVAFLPCARERWCAGSCLCSCFLGGGRGVVVFAFMRLVSVLRCIVIVSFTLLVENVIDLSFRDHREVFPLVCNTSTSMSQPKTQRRCIQKCYWPTTIQRISSFQFELQKFVEW
jgi:hypothetical protein